ncbi:MAG: FAD-dependent oxidoreductase [Dehalococcoidia bacterium]|nr:FAD-dependent oxidoreductase [Dehalococcoidia bacterium]
MRVCIIGTGDGGAVAATQIHRLSAGAQIDLFSSRKAIGCPPCEMPLVISGEVATWEELLRGFRENSFWEKRGIGLHLSTTVTAIDRDARRIVAGNAEYGYDKLVLALGAVPVVPPFPGLDGDNEFTLSTDMADGIALGNSVAKHSEAAIVGGGFIALEIAAALRARGYRKVYLLVRQRLLRSYLDEDMEGRLRDLIKKNGVELILPADIKGIESRQGRKLVRFPEREIAVDFVFFGAGSRPNVELARQAGLKIGETGSIEVNEYLQTSDPDIYAAGDCMQNWELATSQRRRLQSAMNAVRNGYIAGRNVALGNTVAYHGTVMPFVTKIFNHQIGAVGLTEKEAAERGLETLSVTVETPRLRDRFHGKPACYRFIADTKSGALLGAQLMSEEIVTGTIDKMAVAIASKMPVVKLVQLDSCYSPSVQEDQIAVPLHRLIDKLERR